MKRRIASNAGDSVRDYEAYCTACGTRVVVSLDTPPDGPIDLAGVDCLDKVVSCEKMECPLVDITPDNLPNRLEFLPAQLQGGRERGMQESADLVERARSTSVRLQTERRPRDHPDDEGA
jgi:hypothetical protein